MNKSTETREAGFSGEAPGCATALRNAAFGLYQPPFRYESGWIWDANNQFVSDEGGPCHYDARMARIRGWGRIQYLPQPERLQDEIGQMVAEALTAFWLAHNAQANGKNRRMENSDEK